MFPFVDYSHLLVETYDQVVQVELSL
jgi:hypothetical protein